ncbi:hypothetical protein Btru_023802 [Bulinus truncatus]|nr:hypothetical protein Btru_023802 [Bulinus truncatus]
MCTVLDDTGGSGCHSDSCDSDSTKFGIGSFGTDSHCSDEIDYEVESESVEKAYANCKYKSNHKHFISGEQFAHNDHPFHQEFHTVAKHYLPRPYNRRSSYDMVHCLFDLTVLVQRTGKLKGYASGRIGGISGQYILIYTVAHVVNFAKSSELSSRIDYNRSDSPEVILTVVEYEVISSDDDICVLKCSTDDVLLFNNIKERLDRFRSRCQGQYEKMKKKEMRCGHWSMSEWALSNLVVVISHPHAGPKKISLGVRYSVGRNKRVQGAMTYNYTAPTCSGCSGAPVFVFGCPTWDIVLLHRGKQHIIDDSYSKKDTSPYSTCIKERSHDSTFQKDTSHDSTFQKDTSHDSTFQKHTSHDSTFQKHTSHDSTFQKHTSHDSNLLKDTNHDSTLQKDTSHDSNLQNNTSHDSTFQKDTSHDSTFQKDTSHDSTLLKDTNHDSTLQKDTSHDSNLLKDTNHDSTFQKDTSHDSSMKEDTNPDISPKQDTSNKSFSKNITVSVSSSAFTQSKDALGNYRYKVIRAKARAGGVPIDNNLFAALVTMCCGWSQAEDGFLKRRVVFVHCAHYRIRVDAVADLLGSSLLRFSERRMIY